MLNRNGWLARSWGNDTDAVNRWFTLETKVSLEDRKVVLLRRIVGWDSSPPPPWVCEADEEGACAVRSGSSVGRLEDLLEPDLRRLVESGTSEVRRIQPLVADWLNQASSQIWKINLPVVAYEVWASAAQHRDARAAWTALAPPARALTGLNASQEGYLGSTINLLPQPARAFFHDTENLVVVRDGEHKPRLRLVSEVVDGSVPLSRVSSVLRFEPPRELTPMESTRYLKVHLVGSTLSEMDATPGRADYIAELPQDFHGLSGSNWRLTVVGHGICDVAEVGLIRGIGHGYFTSEPWRDRAPELGFSGPARVVHFSPGAESIDAAMQLLKHVGAPIRVCDPYAETKSLKELRDSIGRGCVLTSRKEVRRIEPLWVSENRIQIRVADDLHDRFVVGTNAALLMGTSLNCVGKKHSFITVLDNEMRGVVSEVFDRLWEGADPWP